jgi:hypothetical protein
MGADEVRPSRGGGSAPGTEEEERMRYRIDKEQLSEFLARQVRLVERLPVEAA